MNAAAAMDRPFSSAGLADLGAETGAGLIAALPAGACGLKETARVVRYLAGNPPASAAPAGSAWTRSPARPNGSHTAAAPIPAC